MEVEDIVKDANSDEEALEKLKEAKKNSSGITKFFDIEDKWYLQRKINPAAQYQYAYVLLDTDNAAPELSSEFKFGWRVVNHISPETGSVSTVSTIRDLIGMRIFPVTMQLIKPVGEAGKNYVNNVTNINNNFTILIHEFEAQSFVGREGRKFHFALFPALMNIQYPSRGPGITPANPYFEFTTSGKANGWFWFRQPITEFSTMTISIGNPFDLVKPGANNTRTLIPLQLIYLSEKREIV